MKALLVESGNSPSQRLAPQGGQDFTRDVSRRPPARFHGELPHLRCCDHVRMFDQEIRIRCGSREYIKGGTRHLARVERLEQSRLIDHPAAARAD